MKMVKRMSPRKKRSEGGGRGRGAAPAELESPDTLCDELCRFSLCISGEGWPRVHVSLCVCMCACVHLCVCVCVRVWSSKLSLMFFSQNKLLVYSRTPRVVVFSSTFVIRTLSCNGLDGRWSDSCCGKVGKSVLSSSESERNPTESSV